MRKFFYALIAFSTLFLTGCFDTTEEITLKDDGSGVLTTLTDMSNMIGMAKQFGGEEVKKFENLSKDTSFSLAIVADSMKDLTPAERQLVKNGTMALKINMNDEKFIIKFNLPFSTVDDISKLNKLTGKFMSETMKKQMGDNPMGGPGAMQDDDSEPKLFNEYFDVVYTKDKISRTLNKTKYATVENDESMKALQQMSGMGAPMNINYIINLPRPAKKAEGKGIKLSDDKKKVTVNVTSEDFFENPSKFEFNIEY